MKKALLLIAVLALIATAAFALSWWRSPKIGHIHDEAQLAGLTAADFTAADEDFFHDMDNGASLTPDEIKGRNTWLVWSAGNDRLWDRMTFASVGALDFLKTLSSYPKLNGHRANRWDYFGLVNEPCFEEAAGPRADRYGLWLDTRDGHCPPDPFENEQKYPGVKIGARGKNIPAGSYYGYASGVVGLRLFPNPDFDAAAQQRWDPVRFYTDPAYYNSKDLVRPYRVGMSCGFCHVGPNPIRPPVDRNHPQWQNLSSNVGAQYLNTSRVFFWSGDQHNFIFQLFHTYRPGTLDTSFIPADNINNPRAMNAIYQLGPRVLEARRWGRETLSGGALDNRQLTDFVKQGPLSQLFQAPHTVYTTRVLKDGADSVGVIGALNRVYLNIGTFSEEVLLHFTALVGGKPVSPIEISVARKNSAYFAATEAQTFSTAQFFLKATQPHYLKDAPGGEQYLTKDQSLLTRGKLVFADNCARCHTSKLPKNIAGLDSDDCAGKDYLTCWNKFWNATQAEDFKSQMRKIVLAPGFLENNYLSSEFRVPVTLLQTNACSPLASNATSGHIWDNFSSQSYKDLPSVGQITWYHPVTGQPHAYTMPAGGRGYTRPPSLVSVWSTAPFLLNNSVGPSEIDPSVEGRMRSFQASIEELLWPERREQDSQLGAKIPGMIDRTTTRSFIRISGGYLPNALQSFENSGQRFAPWLFGDGGIELGPLPAGMPVGLLANLDPFSEDPGASSQIEHAARLLKLIKTLNSDLEKLGRDASDDGAHQVFANAVDQLLSLSKCPDLIVNRGHYFGADLPDPDKRALIEFLKTF